MNNEYTCRICFSEVCGLSYKCPVCGTQYFNFFNALHFERVEDVFKSSGKYGDEWTSIRTMLETLSVRYIREKSIVGIYGCTGSGKSTFINACLGAQLLKTANQETTPCITILEYGETATLSYLGERQNALKNIEMLNGDESGENSWDRRMTEKVKNAIEGAQERISDTLSGVKISLPSPVLKMLSLVDLPGFDGHNHHFEIRTRNSYSLPNTALYLVDGNTGLRKQDVTELRQVVSNFKTVYVAINKADGVEKDELDEFIEDNRNRIFKNIDEAERVAGIYATSSRIVVNDKTAPWRTPAQIVVQIEQGRRRLLLNEFAEMLNKLHGLAGKYIVARDHEASYVTLNAYQKWRAEYTELVTRHKREFKSAFECRNENNLADRG